MILRPHQVAGLRASQPEERARAGTARRRGRARRSPDGVVFLLDASPLSIGRAANNDIPIGDDEYASTRHARFEPRRDGVYVEDVGSTNGTYVNGLRRHARAAPYPRRPDPDRRD